MAERTAMEKIEYTLNMIAEENKNREYDEHLMKVFPFIVRDVDVVFQQAKRVAALEIENAELQAKNKDRRNEIYQLKKRYENTASLMNSSNQLLRLKTLTADNDLMREALKFYVDTRHYHYEKAPEDTHVMLDGGDKARQALSEVEVNKT